MAMTAGSVTVNSDGTRTGSGLALALYDAMIVKYPSIPTGAAGVAGKQQIADVVVVFGTIVDYIKANAEVTTEIVAADAGLQQTPNPNLPATPTQGPASTVTLTNKGTIG